MNFVGGVAQLFAFEQFRRDVRVTCRRDQGREPVHAGHDAVGNLVGRHLAWPANDCRYPEATLHDRAFAHGERSRAAIGPGEVFRTIVGGENHDGVVVHAVFFQLRQDVAHNVIELRHTGFLFRPAILRVAHGLVLVGQVRDDVHAGRVEPDEERFVVLLGLVDEREGLVANLLVDGFHPLRIERSGVFDFLLADLAPARHHGRVISGGGPAVDHVAWADAV
ncbi:hypothetical protein D9M71_220980 [compost metagenome]